MNMQTYLRTATPKERERLAKAVKSSVGYFYQLAGGHSRPSVEMAMRLVEAEPRLKLNELRPDVWWTEPRRR